MNFNQNRPYPNGYQYQQMTGIPQNYNPSFGMNYQPAYSPTYSQPQRPQLNGRIVQNPTEVVPDEVKMDGSCSFFPINDGSGIYVMRWSQDGSRIEQVKYVPETPQTGQQSKTFEQLVMERLDSLDNLIRNQNRGFKNKKPFNKEGLNNEHTDQTNNEPNDSK